jgi:glycosyltransferase involved in cell wall biosynthesis
MLRPGGFRHLVARVRLGYTITSYPPAIGGAQFHAHMLARQLTDRFDVRVACFWSRQRTDWLRGTTVRAPGRSRDYDIDGIPVTRIGLSRRERLRLLPPMLGYIVWHRRAVQRIAETLAPHLRPVIEGAGLVHNFRIGREPLTYASAMLAREMGVPFVLTPFHHPRWSSRLYAVYHDLYRSADAVLALTEAERQVLVGLGVARERISVVGHGPVLAETGDAARFRQHLGANGPVVLFLGQKFAYKGLSALLEAAPLVWKSHPSACFAFVGPRTRASTRMFSRSSDPRIVEMDAVSLEEKTDALAGCDLLCVPSSQESFGGVYVEAWAMGKPVVAVDTPATRELIDRGQDGLLVAQDSRSIAEAITRLLDDPALAGRMGSAGRAKVEQRFQWPIVAERVAAVYQDLTARHGAVAEV